MTKVFMVEKGFCRGYEFGSKTSIDKDVLLGHFNDWLSFDGDEELQDQYVENVLEEMGYSHEKVNNILAIIGGGIEWGEAKIQAKKDHYNNIVNDIPFHIMGDEQDWGVGTSPEKAIQAYAQINEEQEESWND